MTENNNAVETHNEPESPVSQSVVGVRFRSCGKMYTFDVNDIDVVPGSKVVVDTEMGLNLGRVVTPRQIVEKTKEPLKKILRVATDRDFETVKNNRSLEDEARLFCIEKVKEINLPMKIVSTETTMDKKRLVFYFTADGRIDFRELVRDLAARFKTRIEMRQIGVRDEVKQLGGFGACGRQTCCSLFLTSFAPITIRMAKEQELSINQSKLSGICGRLMCCLGYEKKGNFADETALRARIKSLEQERKEASEDPFQMIESESIAPAAKEEQTKIPQRRRPKPSSREKTVTTQPEKQSEKQADGDREKKKRFRPDHRRKKKQRQEKPAQESTAPKPAEQKPAGEAEKSDPKNAGKPFNRRRKFWKKKKS